MLEADAERGAIIAEVSIASCRISVKCDSTTNIVEQFEMAEIEEGKQKLPRHNLTNREKNTGTISGEAAEGIKNADKVLSAAKSKVGRTSSRSPE